MARGHVFDEGAGVGQEFHPLRVGVEAHNLVAHLHRSYSERQPDIALPEHDHLLHWLLHGAILLVLPTGVKATAATLGSPVARRWTGWLRSEALEVTVTLQPSLAGEAQGRRVPGPAEGRNTSVVLLITRLNIGGPAGQALLLAKGLEPEFLYAGGCRPAKRPGGRAHGP